MVKTIVRKVIFDIYILRYERALTHDAYFFILIKAYNHDNSFDILFQNSASTPKLFSATCLSFLLHIVYSILHYCTIWIRKKHKMRESTFNKCLHYVKTSNNWCSKFNLLVVKCEKCWLCAQYCSLEILFRERKWSNDIFYAHSYCVYVSQYFDCFYKCSQWSYSI